jgi:uncharacterized membrane protein
MAVMGSWRGGLALFERCILCLIMKPWILYDNVILDGKFGTFSITELSRLVEDTLWLVR